MTLPNAHALIIGIGTYRHHPQLNVPVTATDAESLAAALHNPALCGYPPEQVTLLTGENATRANLLNALHTLQQNARPDSLVTIAYNGHGDYDPHGVYHLSTHDSRYQNGKIQTGTGISAADLLTALREIASQRMLLLFNACFSGELSPTLTAPPAFVGTPLPNALGDSLLSSGEGRAILTACRPHQKSVIGTGKHTLFTQALLNAINGYTVSTRQGYISLFDLYAAVYHQVRTDAQKFAFEQEPQLSLLRGIGDFPIALFRGSQLQPWQAQSAPPPEETAYRTVDPTHAQRLAQNITITVRDGAVAYGDGAVAVGQGGIYIGGKNKGFRKDEG